MFLTQQLERWYLTLEHMQQLIEAADWDGLRQKSESFWLDWSGWMHGYVKTGHKFNQDLELILQDLHFFVPRVAPGGEQADWYLYLTKQTLNRLLDLMRELYYLPASSQELIVRSDVDPDQMLEPLDDRVV